jgi:nitroreductase
MTTRVSPRATLVRVVELARRAPSIHNTQPWRWRLEGRTLELHADRSRHLRAADPDGRNLAISCGAALHHALTAATALGLDTEVRLAPDGPASTLLARVDLRLGTVPVNSYDLLRALQERCTDRRRFTSWPVPDDRLQNLAAAADEWGVRAVPLVDVTERFRLELLVSQAVERQAHDLRVAQELETWVDDSATDGVPPAVLPEGAWAATNRFGPGLLPDIGGEVEGSDGLILITSPHDNIDTWVRAGMALSALWLRAAAEGLSVVPLSQVVEVPETREAVKRDVLGDLSYPHILVRLGWQPISRSELRRTPRRPLEEILDEVPGPS